MTTAPALRRPLLLITVLACLLGGLSLAARNDDATAAPVTVRTGLGRHAGADFVGYYVTRSGAKVYCLVPRNGTPAVVSLHTVGRYPGLSAAASAALGYALATWGDARTRNSAAVESQVVNTLAGNRHDVARRNRHLPTSLRRLVRAHVAQARQLRGPYVLRVVTPAAPLPGGSAVGRVQLHSATGRPVPGVRVDLRASTNAKVPAAVRTDRRGGASFRYSVSDVGEVRVTGAAGGLPATAMRVSDPRAGQQRLAGASARVVIRAAATFRGTVAGFAHRYSCTSDCAGRPAVTLSACAPGSRVASRLILVTGDRPVVLAFAAVSRRLCRSATVTLSDGVVVSGTWQFRTTHGWSRPVAAPGAFAVDCPAPAAVTVAMTYDCAQARVTASSVPAGANSSHLTVLVVSGARTARVYARPGRQATWGVALPCGQRKTLTFRSGVQRRDGGWNYGRRASVVTP